MNEAFPTLPQANSGSSHSVISSLALVGGRLLYALRDGRIIDGYGQALARANLSARQVRALGLLTSGTSGRTSTISFLSLTFQSFLANRLRLRTALLGSTLYKLTWKVRVTESGWPIFALRASAHPKSDSASGLLGWPTPTVADINHSRGTVDYAYRTMARPNPPSNVALHVHLTGWPTATTRDYKDGGNPDVNVPLNALLGRVVWLAGWPTPLTVPDSPTSHGQLSGQLRRSMEACRSVGPIRLTHLGQMLTGCTAEITNGGRLNPAHSRWLMGYPPEWDDCAVTAMPSSQKSPKSSSKA